MKQKILKLMFAGIFTLVFLIGMTSATVIFSDDFNDNDLSGWAITNNPSPLPGTQWNATNNYAEAKPGNGSATPSEGTTTLQRVINTQGFENITFSYKRQIGDIENNNSFNVSFSTDGTNYIILESNSTGGDSEFISKTFNLPSSANNNSNLRIKFECSTDALSEFCRIDDVLIEGIEKEPEIPTVCEYDNGISTNNGELSVKIKDISVINNSFGKDDEWLILDEVEVEIEVKNKGDYDIDDITVEWGVTDNKLEEWVIELDEIDEFNLRNGDSETLTINFRLNKKDLDMDFDEIAGNDYTLVVRATGTIDDKDAGNLDGEDTCSSDSKDISIQEERNFVRLDNIITPEIITCGEELNINAKVWNIGSKDQDNVKVKIYNKELGISEIKEFRTIDSYDNENLDLLIKIPEDAEEKTYILTFEIYDEDDYIYENDYDEDKAIFTSNFKIEGNCGIETPEVIISASLTSGGKAGEPLTVTSTITNTGDKSGTYILKAEGYSSWADSAQLSSQTFTLDSGESKEIVLTFNVNKDISGEKSFNIEVSSSNGEIVMTQPVSVNIEKSSIFNDLNQILSPVFIILIILVIAIIIVGIILIIKLVK